VVVLIIVMSGFDHDLKEKVFGFRSHLTISGGD
jgi:ABC-type lipoprotein release transport system permease subunit